MPKLGEKKVLPMGIWTDPPLLSASKRRRDIDNAGVMDLVRRKDVALEVCPTSNWLCSSVPSTREHPIRRLMEAGVPVTINSDDPGLFGIDLCHEYELLHREHGFTSEEFDLCNETAARHSFVTPLRIE